MNTDNKEIQAAPDCAVSARNISKVYKIYKNPKEKALDFFLPKSFGKDFYALKNVSFEVQKGDVVGLVGLNGSGKSTLADIIAGISVPTEGSVVISGKPALVAISAGLNNQLTGLENIELKCLMSGLKKPDIDNIRQDIIDFSEIGSYISQPVKKYSSGMKSRLGFAISIHMVPDILVIDEALAVGDPRYTEKCLERMYEMRDSGKTIFFVSHSTEQVRQFCHNVIWMSNGEIRARGTSDEIIDRYKEFLQENKKKQ